MIKAFTLLGRRAAIAFAVVIVPLILAGCSVPGNFSMYPTALQAGSDIGEDFAVVLVGNAGPAAINYLQFSHSSLPAINVRDINLQPGTIVAIPIPPGIRELSLQDYTITAQGAGYLPNGSNHGYIPVRTPKIDVTARGVYYVATLLPASQPNFTTLPNAAMLSRFEKTYPQIARMKALNFSWPK